MTFIVKESINFIDTLVSLKGEEPWQCTFLYDPSHITDKQQFWANFHQLRRNSTLRWCVIGDVNILSDQSEKEGGAPVNNSQANWFLDFLDASSMLELPIKGMIFIWSNMRSNNEVIAERLEKNSHIK
ncbi:hypothetical protein V6N11_024470 [Hibiscus sabdariffa]|uniref:Uncharacterized protein n=1 Tax=Hibiscus sabdariffa TaxID=183260 RepID=A0ABR2QM70_9ROSI